MQCFIYLSYPKKKYINLRRLISFFLLVLQTEEIAIRLLLCCGDLAEISTQVEYLHFCGSCRSCQYTCGNRHLECLLLFPYPSGFGRYIGFITPGLGQTFSSGAPLKQPSAFWGGRCASELSLSLQELHKVQHFCFKLWS